MSNAENCKHENAAPVGVLAGLPHSQAGEGRHKCAVCAYAAGFAEGRKGTLDEVFEKAMKDIKGILDSLPPV